MKKKDNYILLIIICIILICIVGLLYLNNNDNKKNIKEETRYYLLDDYSRFFTINNCLGKYANALGKRDTDNLLRLLDKDYINNNKIDSNNLYNFIGEYNGNYSFITKKVYYEEINKNYIKYYVYGYLIEDNIDNDINNKYEKYYIVNFDLNNNLFSLYPYDESIFKEDNNE